MRIRPAKLVDRRELRRRLRGEIAWTNSQDAELEELRRYRGAFVRSDLGDYRAVLHRLITRLDDGDDGNAVARKWSAVRNQLEFSLFMQRVFGDPSDLVVYDDVQRP